MPIYEYECRKCGHGFEMLVRNSADSAPACPKCGAKQARKQFSAFFAAAGVSREAPVCGTDGCGRRCPSGSCPLSEA